MTSQILNTWMTRNNKQQKPKIRQCPISLRPQENSDIQYNIKKYEEGKVAANHVFLISSVVIFHLRQAMMVLHYFKADMTVH
jgi:hypothetical protein